MALWRIEKMTHENGEQFGGELVALCVMHDTSTGDRVLEPVPYAPSDIALDKEFILDALVTAGYTPNDWGGV